MSSFGDNLFWRCTIRIDAASGAVYESDVAATNSALIIYRYYDTIKYYEKWFQLLFTKNKSSRDWSYKKCVEIIETQIISAMN